MAKSQFFLKGGDKTTITVSVVVMAVAYFFGAISKLFINNIPNKYIPIQNVIIGFISGFICYVIDLDENIISAIILCVISTMSAGGIADLIETKKDCNNIEEEQN